MRTRRALYNSISSLILEAVSIICGFILPRVILSAFGSTYNGLTASITQFLSFVTLLRAGVGGVTRAALYKPLAENDLDRISGIVNATKIFMRRIAFIFAAGLVVFALVYPFLVRESFDFLFTCILVLIMGMATFVQYYFAISYQILLIADQRQYMIAVIQSITLILNLMITVILIKLGHGIHAVKLGSTAVFCLNPLLTVLYIERKYSLRKSAEPDNTALSQRWDAFTHQIAAYIQENTDVMVLTAFSSVVEVSVYSVYFLVANGVKKLLAVLTVGCEPIFGNMIALNDYDSLRRNMIRMEYLVFSAATVVYSCFVFLIVPFVSIYTSGITDAEYVRPLFAIVLSLSQFVCCIRVPYQNVADAAGHFKQTRNSAVIEAFLNLSISIVMVICWGLVGVAIGTLISSAYRTVYLMIYAWKHILNRACYSCIKRIGCCLLEFTLIYTLVRCFVNMPVTGYASWFVYAGIVGFLSFVVVLLCSVIFDRKVLFDCVRKAASILRLH